MGGKELDPKQSWKGNPFEINFGAKNHKQKDT